MFVDCTWDKRVVAELGFVCRGDNNAVLPYNWSSVLQIFQVLDYLCGELEVYLYRICIEMFTKVISMLWNKFDCNI